MRNIILLPHFKRGLKPLLKKYPSLKDSLVAALEQFDQNQEVHLGNDLYKLRINAKEIKRGKSKSFRLIVLAINMNGLLVPITVYFKGERENISTAEINRHLEIILLELSEGNAKGE